MAKLIARSPFEGHLPITHGSVTAEEVQFDAITSVAPFNGQAEAVSKALDAAIGCALPAVGRFAEADGVHVAWSGLGQWFVLGKAPGPINGAAITDQTDAWGAVAISGDGARDVLERLVPIDIRPNVFEVGYAARTLLGHMNCLLMRVDADRYIALVFRSMAASAAHDIERAMRMVAARASV